MADRSAGKRKRRYLLLGTALLLVTLLVGVLLASQQPLVRMAVHSLLGILGQAATPKSVRQLLQPAPGYAVTLFAANVSNARWLQLTEAGDLLVSSPNQGQVYRLRDNDGDGMADQRDVLIDGLNLPHGLALHDNWLYIAETDAIGRLPYPSFAAAAPDRYQRIVTGIPGGGNHWRRVIAFGPDDRLYLAIGSSCNACVETEPLRATLVRYLPDGSDRTIIATGLRNATGFDWAPWNSALYATENGRDWLGDDFPPDELNLIVDGGFYGWPFVNGDNIPDPEFGREASQWLNSALLPVHHFAAHNAPLGLSFLRHQPARPGAEQRLALVALHGSWNRSEPDGYKVVALHWDEAGNIEQSDFLTGFLQSGRVSGRPVDVAEATDGSIYISDDFADAIYRVTPLQ